MLKLFCKNNTKHVRLRVKYIFSVSVCSSILGKWSWVSPALLSSIDPGENAKLVPSKSGFLLVNILKEHNH